jgi:hypothetical protein
MRRTLGCIGLGLLAYFLLGELLMMNGVHLVMASYLLFGWVRFIQDVVPRITIEWSQVVTIVICIAILSFGLHRFLSWLHLERQRVQDSPPASQWPVRWSLSLVGLVLLLFTAGIAVVGVTHQTSWILTSPEPMILNRSRVFRAQSVLYQLSYTAQEEQWTADQARAQVMVTQRSTREEYNIVILDGPQGTFGGAIIFPRNPKKTADERLYWIKPGMDDVQSEPIEALTKILAEFDDKKPN